MPTVNPDKMISDEEFERIYRENYDGFLRYAANILKTFGSNYVSVSGRAEEAVQETAAFAWEHREKLASAESPVGWMYTTLYYKVRELLREDRVWTKRMMQISEQFISQNHADFRLKVELETILSPEDYLLLKHLYLDGYTYSELCAEMGLKKSALAMRVKRIKEHFMTDYGIEKKSQKTSEQSPPDGHYIVEEVHGDGT